MRVAREFVAGSEAFALVRGGGGGVLFQLELRTGGSGGVEGPGCGVGFGGEEVEVEQLTQWRDRIPPLSRCSTQTKVGLSPSQCNDDALYIEERKSGHLASFNVFHNKVQLVNERVTLYGCDFFQSLHLV